MNDFSPFDRNKTSQDNLRANPSGKPNPSNIITKISSDQKPRSRRKYYVAFILLMAVACSILFMLIFRSEPKQSIINRQSLIVKHSVSPSPTTAPIPISKTLNNGDYHVFQSFNNCGPAALSIALRFYEITASQAELGQALRPYQIPGGDNDDKSVTLGELAEKSKEYEFIPYHRPMGNPETVKQFIANDIPVITRTWLTPTEDIGHYRVIKGYDETTGTFLQDDSLQNKNLTYSYADFNEIWKKFNYEYLVLVPKEKQILAEIILGENADVTTAWQNAVENSLNELQKIASSPDVYRALRNDVIASDSEAISIQQNEVTTRFNLSVAYYNIGEFQKSVEEFEKVESLLPFRTLWYQIEPIEAYFELKNYDKVITITDRILNNQNRAFSELYILRGKIYQDQNQPDLAQEEFRKALQYNNSLKEARELNNI